MVIVAKFRLTEEPKLSELKAFNESNPMVPYITMAFTAHDFNDTITIGNGKTYSLPFSRNKRSLGSVDYRNVPLKTATDYFILIRAHENQVSDIH